eukprot:Phypoly_transcript_19483.p1 GENE.Phypoly_transcript_19483~~Phypoly_transcript_19483.p1  ORF type:complete len:218 (+),score=58.17 Phypoly_transcript_19483:88-654(+)
MRVNIYTDKNLMAYLAKGWSEDKLVQGKIKTLTGRTMFVEGVEDAWTILQLKRAIEDKEGIPVEKQTLKRGKQLLEDKQLVGNSFLKDGTTLLMFIEGEGVDFTPPSDSTGGLKTKERREGSKVVVVDPTEVDKEEEENKGDWWEKSQMSGPKSRPVQPTPTTATPRPPDDDEQRALRLKAIEARMNK